MLHGGALRGGEIVDVQVARLLDANANRAREGLRVWEDYMRFVCDDLDGASRLKAARHRLSAVMTRLPQGALLAARDVQGDVGRAFSTAQERTRAGSEAVARAAARRVGEALRCLEEYAKIVDAAAAAEFEALRYESYRLEQSLFETGNRRSRLRKARLHVLLTAALCRGDWLETARSVIVAGAEVVQLREKGLTDREWLHRARALREVAAAGGALLIVNDRPDLARLADADGVHVGQDDLGVDEARSIVGGERVVGVSTHTVEQLRRALAARPDYVAVGPMFASTTKPGVSPAGIELLIAAQAERRAAGMEELPIVAIGGIDEENVAQVRAAGGSCVAVSAAVLQRADPAAAVRALRAS